MALWNKDVYVTQEPLAAEELVSYSYTKNLRADANFAPAFSGLHLEGIRQRGTGVSPMGSGADRFGVENEGRTCRFWYDHLEMPRGAVGRIVVDRGCVWQVLSPEQNESTFRSLPQRSGVVTVSSPQLEDGLDVVVFNVRANQVGETIVVLRAHEPEWFLQESRKKRRQDVKREKASRKKDAVRRAKQEEARRLIFGDDGPPLDDVVEGENELPPLWGRALRGETATQYEGVFSVELHFRCIEAQQHRDNAGASELCPMEMYALTAHSSDSEEEVVGAAKLGGATGLSHESTLQQNNK
eukprot:INCI19065.10.p1 GENE.INCI19065.10~~INCI19065.10.p1  ORF type:complete len:342 (-),score=51.79 INCI19065.10:261-1154(-)